MRKSGSSLPILFAGIGPCAEKTLTEFARAAGSLTVPVRGPFGLVLIDSFGEELYTSDWPWISEFRVPELPVVRERSEFVGDSEDKLAASLTALVRRLRSLPPASDPASPSRVRMNSYILVDLSVASAVASATRLVQTLRKVDEAHDMTVVALTGRTAVTSSATDNEWFETWRQLLARIQDEPFAQRIYLLDGCDADKTWFERPEQLYDLGARFLLHHGLLCRSYLRRNERARTGSRESLLNVCGSFGCRTIEADLDAMAERIAERVAREDLAALYGREEPDGWFESIDEHTQMLADKIASVCERTHQVDPSPATQRRDGSDAFPSGMAEVAEAIGATVRHVCSREPLISLCHFLEGFKPKLNHLLSRQRLWDRQATRRFVARAIRELDEKTYEPMRSWLSNRPTEWTDRFTPKQPEPPEANVSRPAGIGSYLAGAFIFVLGLAAVAVALLSAERYLAIGGGLAAIGATALMALPTGWSRHRRSYLCEGQTPLRTIPPVRYRKRASLGALVPAVVLILAGLAGLGWSLAPAEWTPVVIVGAVALAVVSAIGVAFLVGCRAQPHPDRLTDEEAPGHAGPPVWRCRGTALACFALAWTIFCLGAAWPITPAREGLWAIPLGGLLLVGVGVAVMLLPRAGRVRLVDRIARTPVPTRGGIGRPIVENDVDRGLIALAGRINRLALDADQCLLRSEATESLCDRQTLFDFLAADADRQLAEAFRRTLKGRSGTSLRALADRSALWIECIVAELEAPRARCSDLTSLFAFQAVRAWIESQTLPELISMLDVDVCRFGRLAERLAAPHWPASRVEPESGACVIAVGKSLWDVLAPLAKVEGAPAMIPLEWDSESDEVLVLRVVQGLTEGWRGFPGLPGQIADKRLLSGTDGDATETAGHPRLPASG